MPAESVRPPVILEARVVKGSGGGPDKTILNTPRFLDPLGFRTVCAYMHAPADPGFEQLRQKAQRWGAPLLSVADAGPLDWRVPFRLLNTCRREKVAIWHGHEYKSNLLGLMLSRFWKMRLVTTVHGWVHHTSRTPFYYAIDRFCLPRYELVVCVSDDLRHRCLEVGVRPERCVLVENAIDTSEFQRKKAVAEARSKLGFPGERFLLGGVGRLSPEKGFDILLRSLKMLTADGIDAGLVLIGEGDHRKELETLAVELGVRERVVFAGFQGDPRLFYEAMDVFVLSSLREGLPNVVLEALAMETPVVATRIAGIPLVLEDGQNGLVVEPGSAEQLAAGIGRLARDSILRERLRIAGRHTVEARYSFEHRTRKFATLLNDLLRR